MWRIYGNIFKNSCIFTCDMILYNYMNDETERQEKQGNLPHTGVPDTSAGLWLGQADNSGFYGQVIHFHLFFFSLTEGRFHR